MKPADFHPAAAKEARQAATRYEGVQPGLGDEFRTELRATLARELANPLAYAAEAGAIRVAPLHRFPYALIYEVLPDRIWIAAVAHHSRRPGYWSRRRPS